MSDRRQFCCDIRMLLDLNAEEAIECCLECALFLKKRALIAMCPLAQARRNERRFWLVHPDGSGEDEL